MPPRKTTQKRYPLQVVLQENTYDEVIEMAKDEKRSQSQMGAILISEAITARKASSNNSK